MFHESYTDFGINTSELYEVIHECHPDIDAVFDGFETSLAKGLDLEAKFFGELVLTPESQSLVHLFHATTSLKKHRFKDAGLVQVMLKK